MVKKTPELKPAEQGREAGIEYIDKARRQQAIRERLALSQGARVTMKQLAAELGVTPSVITQDRREMLDEEWEELADSHKRLLTTCIKQIEHIGDKIDDFTKRAEDEQMNPTAIASFYKQKGDLLAMKIKLFEKAGLIPNVQIATAAGTDQRKWDDYYTKIKEIEKKEKKDEKDGNDNEKTE